MLYTKVIVSPEYVPNYLLGFGDRLATVAQNCQSLACTPFWGFPWFLLQLQPWAHQLFEDCYNTHGPSDIPTDKNQGSSSPVNEVPTRRQTSDWSAFPEIAVSASQKYDLMWGSPLLLEPLVISISSSATSEWCQELPQHCHITLLIHRLSPLLFVFKSYAMFGKGYPCCALYWV